MTRQAIEKTLSATLREAGWVRLALLFGSVARGRERPESDVDVGFIPSRDDVPLWDEMDLQARLTRACGRTVQLMRLDRAAPGLRWRAARDGIVLHEADPGFMTRFCARAGIEHAELGEVQRAAFRVYRDRLAAGSPGTMGMQ